jgi:hypothetical protein
MNKEQRKNKVKRLYLSPMMPKRFSSAERAEIRKKEKEILGGK